MKLRSLFIICLISMSYLPAKITPLHRAISKNDFKLVCVLVGNEVDVKALDGNGNTPLHTAACYGYTMMARVLLDKGADVNARNKFGETPLHMAAFWGQAQTIAFLLDRGACIDLKNKHGDTALHYAASNGSHEVVLKLLDVYAEDALCNNDGNTPFMCAVQRGNLNIIALFMGFNCGKVENLLETRNRRGLNALDIAEKERISLENIGNQEKREEIVMLLESYARQVTSKCQAETPLTESPV